MRVLCGRDTSPTVHSPDSPTLLFVFERRKLFTLSAEVSWVVGRGVHKIQTIRVKKERKVNFVSIPNERSK